MAWIVCTEEEPVFIVNEPLTCLDEDWRGMGMCRYCADIDEYEKAVK